MFDVRPVDIYGRVDFSKVNTVQSVINLGRGIRIKTKTARLQVSKSKIKTNPKTPQIFRKEKRFELAQELEKYINGDINPSVELASVGGELHNFVKKNILSEGILQEISKSQNTILKQIPKPLSRRRAEKSQIFKNEKEDDYRVVLSQIYSRPPVKQESVFVGEMKRFDFLDWRRERNNDNYKKTINIVEPNEKTKKIQHKIHGVKSRKLLFSGMGIVMIMFLGYYGVNLKEELVSEGNMAVASLESAGENIKNMDFASASDDFSQAYQEFSKAGDSLNFMGASISSMISDLPGAGKLKSAQNLVEVGKLMSDAGTAMSNAMNAIGNVGLIFNPDKDKSLPMGEIIGSLKNALTVSSENIKKADEFLANIDLSIISENKRSKLEEFSLQLPVMEKFLSDGVEYSKFLESFIDVKGSKKYLILFQNPSELRPTGGFPGTYAILSFENGRLQDFKVDNIYNPDGQLKENFVPPLELQHIAFTWAMRDSNWFIDFPTSARKIKSFFKKEIGYEVDGVMAVSPKIISQILEVVGPVEMPEYGVTLNSENAVREIQNEVEYGPNRIEPKQIILDMAPKLMEKIKSADTDQWLNIFNSVIGGLDKKDILLYSNNLNLQSFAVEKGFAGQVKTTDSDYLMATFTNIKGSKTDAVTDTLMKVDTRWEDGDVIHKVTLTRKHNGGDLKYGFYNKQNPAYVRVLVPEGSELISIKGNNIPNFKPLIDYSQGNFVRDEDLEKFESNSIKSVLPGVTLYKESGKTEFGFWLITDAGKSKTVEFEYVVPSIYSKDDYSFYVQKQPGLEVSDFEFTIQGPSGKELAGSSRQFEKEGGFYSFTSDKFEKDMEIKTQFR